MYDSEAPLGIYVHIPFCVRKCRYCDFLSGPAGRQTRERYIQRLKEEIGLFEPEENCRAESVFFGGGTPSLLEGEELAGLMEKIKAAFPRRNPDWEVTVECNPGTVTEDKLAAYRQAGVNRLSFGLQSADEEELRILGRIHTWKEFEQNYRLARRMGFENINVDLMFGLPGQTEESWRSTLEKVLELKPEHISAYSLIIEEGTPFYRLYGEGRTPDGEPALPDEDAERAMYKETERILKRAGLNRYEISNYSLPGRESRHNCGYWRRIPYAGFGLGASSQLNRLRFKNTDSLEAYLEGDFSKREVLVLTRDNEIEETMFLGLRMMEGVNVRRFKETFGTDLEVIYRPQIERMEKLGLLAIRGGNLCLTERGIDVSNQVLAEFLLD